MAVDDVRQRVRVKLEQMLGAEEASWLMDRPPGGWNDLVTNPVLDSKLSAFEAKVGIGFAGLEHRMELLEHRVLAQVDRRLRAQTWITTTALLAGLGLAFTAGRMG
jgi:hypothetical protein